MDGDDRWSIAIAGSVAAVATAAVLAAGTDLAASVGNWFVTSAPFAANAVLASVTVGPLAVAIAAICLHQRDAGTRRELARRSSQDALTGLPDRTRLDGLIARAVRTTRDGAHQCAVLFCDLDRFKQVNDAYGHDVGDHLMVAVAERITAELTGPQWAVRYGGDEFVIVAGGLRGAVDAERLAGRIIRSLEQPFELGPDAIRISASIGVALSERGASVDTDLLRDADIAMYHAKSKGSGSVSLFDRTMRGRLSRATASSELEAAVENGEIGVRYAPVMAIQDGALLAVRAELHWEHGAPRRVSPRQLVTALEDTGLIVRVGAWLIEECCRHAQHWRTVRPSQAALQVLVPVPARLLAQASFRDNVAKALAATGTRQNQLGLVVGDHTLDTQITDAWTMLRHVRTLGVRVVLDGFGSGRSSVADLRHARLDQLYLDPELVEGLDHSTEDAAIVTHLIALAHELGIIVTADDITSPSQLAVLRRLGCDRVSGPFLGLALLPDDVDLLLGAPLPPAPPPPQDDAQLLPRLRVFGGPAEV
jgi:diguanylate cyclase (GGDEF)-like protein